MRAIPSVLVLLGCLCGIGAAQESKPAPDTRPVFLDGAPRDAFLARVEKQMSAVRSVAASFHQEKKLAIFKDVVRSTGVLAFANPNLLRWEIREPFRSILVVAGREVRKFEFADGQRRPLQLGRGADLLLVVMERIRQLFVGKFDRNEYTVDAAEKPVPTIRLTPKSGGLGQLLSIELRLLPGLDGVETVTIQERSGDSTVMRFTQLARDVTFTEGMFSVTDPAELDPKRLAALPPDKKVR